MTEADLEAIRDRCARTWDLVAETSGPGWTRRTTSFDLSGAQRDCRAMLAENDRLKRIADSALDLCKTRDAEVERLRAALEALRIPCHSEDDRPCVFSDERFVFGKCVCGMERQNAEIDKALRGGE